LPKTTADTKRKKEEKTTPLISSIFPPLSFFTSLLLSPLFSPPLSATKEEKLFFSLSFTLSLSLL
tara:strand:+ start:1102 stop:1296 length:195 start_codon:yes stop_codon:yes gene_type:complete